MIECRRRLSVFLFFGIALIGISSCAFSTSSHSSGREVQQVEGSRILLIEAIWAENEKAVLEAIALFEGDYDGILASEFSHAVDFFEETTAILSDTGTLFGRLPTANLRDTLDSWNGWFLENKHTLVLNPSKCLSKAPGIGDPAATQEMGQP